MLPGVVGPGKQLITLANPKLSAAQVRVDGFNYIGMGNSTNKKDAQTNAARDFVNYLVRVGEMSAAEVPALGVSAYCCCFFSVNNERKTGFQTRPVSK